MDSVDDADDNEEEVQWMHLRLADAGSLQKSHRSGFSPTAFGGVKCGFLGATDGFLLFVARHDVKHVTNGFTRVTIYVARATYKISTLLGHNS
jgi:hypothetical protein